MSLLDILVINFIFDLSFFVFISWMIIKIMSLKKIVKELEEKLIKTDKKMNTAEEKIKILIQNPRLARKMYFTPNKN